MSRLDNNQNQVYSINIVLIRFYIREKPNFTLLLRKYANEISFIDY